MERSLGDTGNGGIDLTPGRGRSRAIFTADRNEECDLWRTGVCGFYYQFQGGTGGRGLASCVSCGPSCGLRAE